MARCVMGLTPIENGSGGFGPALIETPMCVTVPEIRSIAETVWSVLFTTRATGFASKSSTATPVGLLPTATGAPMTAWVIRFTSDTVLLPVFTTTAIPPASSTATADGPDPTGIGAAGTGDPGIELGLGVTPRFKADMAATPKFCTTIGYKPGVPRSPGGIDKNRDRKSVV